MKPTLLALRVTSATTSNLAKFAGKASCALELPIVPVISLPKSFKEVVKACQIFSLNVFTFVPVGCFGGFIYYRKTAMMTMPVVVACTILICLGFVRKKPKLSSAAIAIAYLTLPTITMTVFGLSSCDSFDNDRSRLRADLSIDCKGADRWAWEAYGYLMILLFPIGATLSWWGFRLTRTVEERLEDKEILGIVFSW